jgi:hypothetical protein
VRTSISLAVLAVVVSLACSGCIALSARAHVGAVASELGSGVQGGVTLGSGLPVTERSAVTASIGVATGTAPKLGIIDTVDYVHLPERDAPMKIAWRAGLGFEYAFVGAPILGGAHFAAMYVVRDRYSYDRGGEKFGGSSEDRSVVGVGLEAQIGLAGREGAPDPMTGDKQLDRGVGATASVTVEWLFLTRMSL